MHNNIQQTTFWNFLKKRKIEIPIIQRDYAQGRIGKEKLREKFLTDIKKALDGDSINNKVSLKLDFVYGSVENNRLNPLDGQQRLTTLWLLHWYIAYKAGVLQNNKEIFNRFTYETRATSREFCNKLSDFDIKDKKSSIIELIQNQTWYYSAWKQDPTIQAMLNMLGGTPIKDEKKNEIIDGIEEVFNGDLNFKEYWKKLTSNNCPIIFYYLDLLDLTLSDDLYIKMNARGKPLTNFENFKADLVGFVNKNSNNNNINKPEKSISHKLDTSWTDIFWKSKSSKNTIDQIYFAFINRHFLNKIITTNNFTLKEIESNKTFEYLYGKDGDDTNIQYNEFNIYKSDPKLLDYVQSVEKVLDAFHLVFSDFTKDEINKLFLPSWGENSEFKFIPEYNEKHVPSSLKQTERVVFYAICCYFENTSYIESSFKQWLRVVWNIVENANIYNVQTMVGTIRLIHSLSKNSHNIYEHLKDRDISNDFANEQMEEEKEKAKQIFNDSTNTWEIKINEAEKAAFFKGAIRILFRKDKDSFDWQNFDARYNNLKQYFDKGGVAEYYKKDAILLRNLISHFTDWEQFWEIKYDSRASSWKTILTNKKWITPSCDLLDHDISSLSEWSPTLNVELDDSQKILQKDLVSSTMLYIIQTMCELHWARGKYVLYPPRANAKWKKYILRDPRNNVFSKLMDDEIITCGQRLKGTSFFWGWEIEFKVKFSGKKFRWWYSLQELNESEEWVTIADISIDNLAEYLTEN